MAAGYRVLVVDDDASVRRALERAFRIAGYAVDFATNVREGLEKLNGHQVALVDLDLPDGQGTQLLLKIRRGGGPIRVGILRGVMNGEGIVAGWGEGSDGLFKKPMEI